MKLKTFNIKKYIYFELGNQFALLPTILIDKYVGDIEFTFQWFFLTISISYVFNSKN